jgi:TonB-linked SusC/RagA family outer membrane protein
MLSITQVFAQNRTVTGTVTAKEDGLPIPGVTVKVVGTTIGTNTNSNGEYSISVPPGAKLQFGFIGYAPQTVTVKGTKLNISLESSSKELGEVVVTGAFGIKTQSRALGYSTATISNKELNQAAVTNAATGLEGKVSGLQVNLTDNGIDPSVRLVLQGNRSITGNNEALLVVDGITYTDVSYLNTLNPEDIESETILKGGLAAAVYGSKAANGVLVVTTKKGSKGKPSITVSNTTEIQSVSYLPKLQTQFGGYGGEGGKYVNADGTVNPVPFENESYGPAFDGRKILLSISPIYAANGVTVTGYDTLFTKYSNINNNRRDFFVNGITNQFNVSYDIGNDNSTLHVGFNDIDQGGVVPNDHNRTDNLRIGGTQTYGKFGVEYNAAYNQKNVSTYGPSYNQTSGGFSGDPLYFEVLNTPADIPFGNKNYTLQSSDGPVVYNASNWSGQFTNPNSYYNAYATNPYWTIANSRNNADTYTFQGNVNLTYKPVDWLTFSDRLGIVQLTEQQSEYRAGLTFEPWAIKDPQNAGNIPSALQFVYPITYDATFMEQQLQNTFLATFDKKINSDFSVNGVVGADIEQNYQRYIDLEGDELQFPGDYNISSTLGIPEYGETTYRQRDDGIFEEVQFAYKNWLFLHGTNRDEWNSVLAQNHNHYEYPSVDGSFVFTDAISALKNNAILNYGKLTTGVAEVANINLGAGSNPYGAYDLINPFNVAGGFPYGSLGGYAQSSLALNPNIQPEKTTDYEYGLELGFLKDNRFDFKVNYSHSDSKNQSLTAAVSSATGYTSELSNAGLVTNNTLELDLNAILIKTRNFQWTLGLNYSHYANKVIALTPGVSQLEIGGAGAGGIYAVVGKPYPILEEEDFVRDPVSGKVIVDPVTGQPSVSSALTDYGTTNPTKILGVNSSFAYKSFSFSFVIDYRGGNEIYNSTAGTEAFTGISAQSAQNGRQRFIFPNSVVLQNGQYVNNTSVAVDNGNGGQGGSFWAGIYGSNLGSIYVEDAAFIKLREANLTFTLPASALTSVPFIKKASISLIGRNLLMIRPKSNDSIDPEFSDAGSGNAIGSTSVNQTPPTRFYGATLSVTF